LFSVVGLQPSWEVIGKIDVSWRAEIVAGHEDGLQRTGAFVRNPSPRGASEHDRMAAYAAVGRGQHVASAFSPRFGDAVERFGREVGAVGQDDRRGGDLGAERGEPAAKRGAGAPLPVGAPDCARVGLDVVRAEHDDDLAERAGATDAREHFVEEELLLRRAEPRRGSGGEHYGGDHRLYVQPLSSRQSDVTFSTYDIVTLLGAPPARSTAVGPALYAASARSDERNRSSI